MTPAAPRVVPSSSPSDLSSAACRTRHGAVATSLAGLSDRQLGELLALAPVVGEDIGGTSSLLIIDDVQVFAKSVPLADVEREPAHAGSTANVFGLPPWCQYGVASPGFGAWRELAAHAMTTGWVLDGACETFPLMYHWRVLES